MRYASQPDVLRHLKIRETDVETIDRLIRLEHGLADAFEHRTGRRFVEDDVAPVTRIVQGYDSDLLVLPVGVWRVDAVEVFEPVSGWRSVMDAADWLLWGEDARGAALGIRTPGGSWHGLTVGVTGLWADQDTVGVPADVREALTMATVKEYRRITTSPNDQAGPSVAGLEPVPTPSGLNDPLFKAAIDRHRVRRRRVGV